MSTFRPATHLSSAYHRSSATFPLGRYCGNADCDHRDHVPAYPFSCVNPHCLNPAHRQEDPVDNLEGIYRNSLGADYTVKAVGRDVYIARYRTVSRIMGKAEIETLVTCGEWTLIAF